MKKTKASEKSAKNELAVFLFGRHKLELLRFCAKKKHFYQAEATFALGWRVSVTQYYLARFVRHGLLTTYSTPSRTYYDLNPTKFSPLSTLI